MNNIQLSLLLSGYVVKLDSIREGLVRELEGIDVAREICKEQGEWIGEGKKPFFDPFPEEENYKWDEIIGDPFLVKELDVFIEVLEDQITLLREQNE